ncbi:uncharacterized protein LOC109859163 isoform X2 [Pseudomyrmex gracilis]|uniref:uncharacterized protein LOC109859163 isoform X2 n=1 Tax=Pseudomyrmex gracilis TaxID=219809 RepID=UPI000995D07C|nr:uncharacterized protein LOC109859163 isoform X2 [Pseudomyrmex gracilis]
MSPGINGGGSRNTGTLPKSNRRNDRNRERSAANQQNANRSAACHGHPQHFNNLCQLDWQTVRACESEPRVTGAAKNSNTRSASSRQRSSYFGAHQGLPDCASHSSARLNYSTEDCISWMKMVPPVDSRTQSPPRLQQEAKPSNVENADADTRSRKMPDRNQVESRLDQIRDYIKVTATMMDSLSQSSDPRAQAQNEKLSRMVEDLRDSETKLSKLLEQYNNNGISDESVENGREDMDERGDGIREVELLRNIEEYQTKLVQLQEHQANLVDMQTRVRERLNEARQAQRMLLLQDNQNTTSNSTASEGNYNASLPSNVERLETETAALRGKLAQLQSKKKRMDHLVAELQAIEQASDKSSSCNCEDSRNTTIKDKVAELAAMKAQLAHIKALVEDGARMRDSVSELEQDVDADSEECGAGNHTVDQFGLSEDLSNITYESSSSFDKADKDEEEKPVFGNVPTIEEMNAITRELKEQRVHIDAEIQRLRQTSLPALMSLSSSSPPTIRSSGEKKQSNKVSTGVSASAEIEQMKRLEDLLKKLPNRDVNRDAQAPDQNSQRSSGSRCSHSSTPANLWPSCAVPGSNEQSVDGISTSDNLLDMGSQTAAVESVGFNGNLCACSVPPPLPPMNQSQHASVEYYRHLLSGAQTTQLQVMGTTLNHCCQLLWAQQRELQSLRTAITQLQSQVRSQNQENLQRINNVENQEEHCNLSRGIQNLGENGLDGTLPPSSSLPNLVSLPNSTATLSHTPIVTSNSQQQQQQQQQLNNQVPPGNRANNYWDNFRSYSRQNLLSGNVKTVTDSPSTAVVNSVCSANTTNTSGSSVNSSLIKDKRNREQGTDNLSLTGAEAQYSLNLQLPSNLQQQDRENTAIRSNIMASEVSQQVDNLWEEAFRLPSASNDDNPFSNLSSETREAISSLVAANKKRPDYLIIILREIKAITEDHRLRPHLLRSLRALQIARTLNNPLNEAPDLTQSESCQSSDEDSDVGAMLGFCLENPSSATELVASHMDIASSPASSQVPLIDQLETSVNNIKEHFRLIVRALSLPLLMLNRAITRIWRRLTNRDPILPGILVKKYSISVFDRCGLNRSRNN